MTIHAGDVAANDDVELAHELRRLAGLVLGSHGNADHLVEDVMATSTEHDDRHSWSGPVSRRLWLYTLTVRRCRAWLNGLAPSQVWAQARESEHAWAEPVHVVDADAVSGADAHTLLSALGPLPDVDRIAVVLHDAMGLTVNECSTVTRTAQEITRMQLRRGRQNLLDALSGSSRNADSSIASDDPVDCEQARAGARIDDGEDIDAVVHARDERHRAACSSCASLAAGIDALRARLGPLDPAGSAFQNGT